MDQFLEEVVTKRNKGTQTLAYIAVNVAWLTPDRSHIIAAEMRRRMRASFRFCPRI